MLRVCCPICTILEETNMAEPDNTFADVDRWIKILSAIGAVIVFGWGTIQFKASHQVQAETRRIEATKPFLERQLTLYTQATQAAATIATSKVPLKVEGATAKFWSLYWGELALVEDTRVAAAMMSLGDKLKGNSSQEALQLGSLELARACRDSLAESWGVKLWKDRQNV